MRDTHKTIIWVILVLGSLCAARVAGQEVKTERELREWIEARLDLSFDSFEPRQGLILEYTLTRSVWLSPAELERQWRSVEDHPDHPDRSGLEVARRLMQVPEIQEGRIALCDQRDTWRFDTHPQASDGRGASRLQVGGHGEKRWMAGDGWLVITHLGVPFPSYRNVGMLFWDMRRVVATVFYGALPLQREGASVEVESVSTRDWRVLLRWNTADHIVVVEGERDPHGQPIVTEVWKAGIDAQPEGPWRFSFQGYRLDDSGKMAYPQRVIYRRNDGIQETYEARLVHLVSRAEVAALGEALEPNAGDVVEDFDDKELAFSVGGDEIPAMVWTRDGERDVYRLVDEANKPTSSGTQLNVGSPEARNETEEVAAGRGSPHRQRSPVRTVSIIVVITVVVGLPMLVYWLRRQQ